MEILRDTNIDFMKYRKFWITVSLIVIAAGVFAIFFHGKLNVGVDFAGGTQVTVGFKDEPPLDELRSLLAGAGLGDVQIQRFGDAGDNEVMIKTALVEGSAQASRDRIVAALNQRYNQAQEGKLDLNNQGAQAVAGLLAQGDPDGVGIQGPEAARAHYEAMAERLMEARRDAGLFTSWDQVAGVDGLSPGAVDALRRQAALGDFTVLGVESVGPQIGEELRQRGTWAVVLSLLGMLAYIWVRFELRFGIGALMACVHDVLVTLGIFALAGYEFNLTTVAAFLTLVGYSVNDSVVIFDRIRENMRKSRREPLVDVMNRSINQTLSRTILTGGSTLLTLSALYFLGGHAIRGFAFVMLIGIIIGTYSSIYIASPFALLWERFFGRAEQRRAVAGTGGAPTAERPSAVDRPRAAAPGAPGDRRRERRVKV